MDLSTLPHERLAHPERSNPISRLVSNIWLVFFLITTVHAAIAIYYKEVVGIDIRVNPLMRPWDWWWQTIPVNFLVHDLWRSLWYLHYQPPLFNLYGAFFFNIFPNNPMPAMQYANILLGSLISGIIYLILLRMTGYKRVSALAGLFLALDPALFLFEAYILYDILSTFCVVVSVWALAGSVHTQKIRFAALFVLATSVLVLVRTAYHLTIIAFALGLVILSVPRHSKKVLLVGSLIALLPLGWYAKNYCVFGFFGATSWQGFMLWKVAGEYWTPDELAQLADQGVIAPLVAKFDILQPASSYIPYGFTKTSNIPLLNLDDRHNINLIDVAKVYQSSALRLIAKDPSRYLIAVFRAYTIFNTPSAQFKHLTPNAQKIPWHVWIYAQVFQGRFLEGHAAYSVTSFLFYLIPLSCFLYLGTFLNETIRKRIGLREFLRKYAVDTWIVLLISYTTVSSILFEIGENNREKFYIDQLVFVYLLVITIRIFNAIRYSKKGHLWK